MRVCGMYLSGTTVRAVVVLDHPKAIDNSALLVIGHLFEVQMRVIVRLEAKITKVLTVEGAPGGHAFEERFASFMIASCTGYDVYGCSRIYIWSTQATIVHGIIIHRPHAFVAMLVCPQLHIHAEFVEQRLQTKEIQSR